MQAKVLLPVLAVCAAFGLMMVGMTGCGDDDGDSGSETNAATTAPSDTAAEPGQDSAAAGNAPAPSGDAVRSAKVEIEDFAYNPDPVTIEEGGKVTWINRDSEPHTATAEGDGFDTGTLEQGKLKSESFKEPGTYPYICTIHPEMHGTVEVVEAS